MLQDKTDKVIIAELEKGALHPSELARLTKLPRTTITYRLNRLHAQKIATPKIKGRKVIWEINYNPVTSESIKIHSGDNFKNAYSECLKIKSSSVILSVQGMSAADHELKSLPRALVFKIHNHFKKNNIVFKSITNAKALELFSNIDNQYIQSHTGRAGGLKLFKDDRFLGDGEIAICEQFVLITNPKERNAVVIKDEGLIRIMLQTITLLFDSLDEIRNFDLNEYLKKIKTF